MSDSSKFATTKGMISVIDFVKILNENGKYTLGIGKIEDTNDLYITLNCITVSTSNLFESMSNEGKATNCVLETTVFAGGQCLMDNDTSVPLKTRYINFLKEQYNMAVITRRDLHKFVKDFKCIVDEKKKDDHLLNIHY